MARAITTGGTLAYAPTIPANFDPDDPLDAATGYTANSGFAWATLGDIENIGEIADEHVMAEGADLESGASEGYIEGVNYGSITLSLFFDPADAGQSAVFPNEGPSGGNPVAGRFTSASWGPAGQAAFRVTDAATNRGGAGRRFYFQGVLHSPSESQRAVGGGFLMRTVTIRRNTPIVYASLS